ncbi:MAG: PQQ-binding-like beta-propeller repeat protein [Lentisphaerae bacterium]|jgi:outer membrane protein assembly factor BamB|nr:PQQ-binding-like beta-propeller repeat protein [Lentisphaerota bacterium]MBT4820143.1 PQQ-binding-like beta-propeller repeat protein [Lentisphaerota bacterium]MBT5613181.1 PQQ-binding-like beta-propeller repeat protein [Lentisphaerota bacterium]MBT7061850.1 PQQ-binding-like beta-propeller repeat protein [Lentisphaerota bacterium]MBT7843676.1 PQQ-binding-like beta-propeller repeat protein [Lentisphaerota bacterium]
MRWRTQILVAGLGAWSLGLATLAADWPTWRLDTGRTASSPAPLPAELHLQWRRELGPFAPAWPLESRLQFDPCYEPVAAGQLLFVGSPADGSVSAFDTRTGALRWRVYTEGPVRFAPVAWESSLYVASDDGRVYCLDAASGKQRWAFRAAPEQRPDLRHLGNNHLISAWPVRGGPVISDGILYCGSGVWSNMGTFVYALDARTGKTLWCNNRLNYLTNIRTDHNRIADSTVAPQGYLVLSGGKLIVPNGRSMPVGLNPENGDLLYAIQGYRNGHCRVTAHGKHIYVGPNAVLDIETGREMGERWHEGHPETPKEYSKRIDLFEAPHVPYKFVPGCDAWSVLGKGTAYGASAGVFYAHNVAGATRTTYERRNGLKPGKWDVPELWKLPTSQAQAKPASRLMIRAGNRLYGHVGQTVVGVDLPQEDASAKLAWERVITGAPATMLAADERLFVVTQEGDILCFGAEAPASPTQHARTQAPLRGGKDTWSQQATELLKHARTQSGYCLVLGLDQGQLVEELLKQSKLKIIAVDPDKKRVDRFRDRLATMGVYRKRVEALAGDLTSLRLPPYIASIIASESATAVQLADRIPATQMVTWLRPYGGIVCLQANAVERDRLAGWLGKGELENVQTSGAGDWLTLRRVGALPGSSHWTHECASAARTYFSPDKRVKAPLGILWYGDGPDHGFKKRKDYHAGVKPQVVNGVVVAFEDRSKHLRAYDVYTGRLLWETPADQFTRFASMPDGIYAAQADAVLVYDPVSGRELRKLPYGSTGQDGKPLAVADIRVGKNVVVVAGAFEKVRNIPKGLYNSDVLVGLDRRTGKQLWSLRATDRFNHHGLAVGGDRVFIVDSPSADKAAAAQRRGNPPETLDSTVLALDARTGKPTWKRVFANPFLSYHDSSYPQGSIQSLDDALFYSAACDVLIVYKDRRYRGVNAGTGEPMWEIPRGAGQPIMIRGETFYNQGGGLFDVRTGEALNSSARVRGGNGCNHAVAGEHLIFRRTFTAAFFDVHDGKAYYMRNARSGCTNSLIAADGVLSSPCFSVGCVCNHPLETSFCLVHMPGIETWAGTEPLEEPLPLGERDPAKWRK